MAPHPLSPLYLAFLQGPPSSWARGRACSEVTVACRSLASIQTRTREGSFHWLPNESESHLDPQLPALAVGATERPTLNPQLSASRGVWGGGPLSQSQQESSQEWGEPSGQAPGSNDLMETGSFKLEPFS